MQTAVPVQPVAQLAYLPPMSVPVDDRATRTPLLILAIDRSIPRSLQLEKDATTIYEKLMMQTPLSPMMRAELVMVAASVDRAADTLHAALVLIEQSATEERVVREGGERR